MSDQDPGQEYMQLGEAAELLGVSRFKMSRWVREGTLPVFRSHIDGRQRLVRRSDVLALREPEPMSIDELSRRRDGDDTKAAA